jgi:two-component system, NtrC family, sensor kinase
MKLIARLLCVLIAVIIAAVATNAYLRIQREIKLFDSDMEQDDLALGKDLRSAVVEVWGFAGEQRALEMIAGANQGEHLVRTRWVWLGSTTEDAYRPRVSREELEPLFRGESISFKKRGEHGGYRYTYVPVSVDASRPAAIEISEPLTQIDAYTRKTVIRTLVSTGVMVTSIVIVMAIFGVWLIGRPLHRLTEKAKRVGLGDLSGPLHIPGHHELSELAASMNAMCKNLTAARERIAVETAARIEALEELRHADRLRTVGRLATGIANEMGAPLAVVSGRAALLESDSLSEAETAENARIIRTQAERMTALIRQLLNFARRQPAAKVAIDVRRVVGRALELLGSMARKHDAMLSLVGDDAPMIVKADAGQLDQALTNIVMNALQAVSKGGKVEVSMQAERTRPPEDDSAPERRYIRLSVQDDGDGISEEDLPHIFEPFFTTRQVGQGTGLGLSIAYGIIHEHGGWITVSSEVGKGSRFNIYLPEGSD